MSSATAEHDRAAILGHIQSIFEAYIRRDRNAIRRTHTLDWTGFQGPSTKIERGIDDYMVNADLSLATLTGTGFELLDSEVQFRGNVALVYYVARYDYRDAEGAAHSVPLRALDVYERDGEGWIQCGSHIAVIPAAPSWKSSS
jgi:ketosteroid isomerase-like protein